MGNKDRMNAKFVQQINKEILGTKGDMVSKKVGRRKFQRKEITDKLSTVTPLTYQPQPLLNR